LCAPKKSGGLGDRLVAMDFEAAEVEPILPCVTCLNLAQVPVMPTRTVSQLARAMFTLLQSNTSRI
jgi:hypothetical protein